MKLQIALGYTTNINNHQKELSAVLKEKHALSEEVDRANQQNKLREKIAHLSEETKKALKHMPKGPSHAKMREAKKKAFETQKAGMEKQIKAIQAKRTTNKSYNALRNEYAQKASEHHMKKTNQTMRVNTTGLLIGVVGGLAYHGTQAALGI